MITLETNVMILGYSLGLVLGTMPSLIGFVINSAFRWFGY